MRKIIMKMRAWIGIIGAFAGVGIFWSLSNWVWRAQEFRILNEREWTNQDHLEARKELDHGLTKKVPLSWLEDEHVVRDCITGDVLATRPRISNTELVSKYHFKAKQLESADARKTSFVDVFQKRRWGKGEEKETFGGLSSSGPGSTIMWSQEVIGALHNLINQLKLLTGKKKIRFLDVPCGDFQWMGRFLETRKDIEYTGIDIVPDIIANHKKTFAGRINWKFKNTDIIVNPLEESYDLILCRMVLQHLFSSDVFNMLNRFSESNSSFLLTTTFLGNSFNKELPHKLGRFRYVNLEIPPFSLVPPACLCLDGPYWKNLTGNDGTHYLGLWKLPLYRLPSCSEPVEVKHSQFSNRSMYSCVQY